MNCLPTHEMSRIIFSEKYPKKIKMLSSAAVMISAVRVKSKIYLGIKINMHVHNTGKDKFKNVQLRCQSTLE